ncbi:hypothetical protein Tco_0577380, partial [Tanacetum coccineum]
ASGPKHSKKKRVTRGGESTPTASHSPKTLRAVVGNAATTTATPADVGKDKDVPTPSIFAGSSSSDKTDRTLSLFTERSGSDFVAGSI